MVKALDQRPEVRRLYRSLYDRAARADEPRIHRSRGARVSLGRRELISGAADLRREAASHAHVAAHSITSSASASTPRGIVRPSALAVFRLITSSNLVGACTGRSAGFSPFRIRST